MNNEAKVAGAEAEKEEGGGRGEGWTMAMGHHTDGSNDENDNNAINMLKYHVD